ncbi:MAG: epoxyqueuosine reductase QueH, partial [Eggerthellaceae bacterium]|nr:epoxyqueuosine reductase QueH [Eggerthellaceae bacterium]
KMWFQAASGFGYENKKERCRTCYRLRFEETAMVAKTAGIPLIGTTLSVSPYQDAKMIEVELENAAARYDLQPFFEDYSPYYERATERSRELGMYRQNYCGCCFSKKEAEREREQRKTERHEQAEAYRREHADEIAEEQRRLEERREQKREYEETQARKHEILRNLRMQNRRSDPD